MQTVHTFADHRGILSKLIAESKTKDYMSVGWENSMAIIDAMTNEDQKGYESLDQKAINRIVLASGTTPAEVSELFLQYVNTNEMFQNYWRMNWWQRLKFFWKLRMK